MSSKFCQDSFLGNSKRRSFLSTVSAFSALSSLTTPANAFLDEILHQFAQGGGVQFEMGGGGGIPMGMMGGGMHQMQRQEPEPQWPSGIEEKISKEFNWLKGTEWYWNRWRSVKFNKDGTFSAPTPSCQINPSHCKWAGYKHGGENKVFVLWGSDGLHTMKVVNHNVDDSKRELPTDQDLLENVELVGWKALDNREPSGRKEKLAARFEKVSLYH